MNWNSNISVCLGFFSTIRNFTCKNRICLGFNVFILLVTCSSKNNDFLYLERLFAKATCSFSFCSEYVFILLLTRAFKKKLFVYGFLCLSKCAYTSTFFPKIPTKVKFILSIASLQRRTHDSCLCYSVVSKMSSQVLT